MQLMECITSLDVPSVAVESSIVCVSRANGRVEVFSGADTLVPLGAISETRDAETDEPHQVIYLHPFWGNSQERYADLYTLESIAVPWAESVEKAECGDNTFRIDFLL